VGSRGPQDTEGVNKRPVDNKTSVWLSSSLPEQDEKRSYCVVPCQDIEYPPY
jgi:hypothetical protein